jgi:hypothetical protein
MLEKAIFILQQQTATEIGFSQYFVTTVTTVTNQDRRFQEELKTRGCRCVYY